MTDPPPQPQPEPETQPEPQPEPEPKKPRNIWRWISGALAIVAVGLLVWALTLKSDKDDAEKQLAGTRTELDSTKQELGTTKKDLESAQANADERDGRPVLAVGGLAAAKSLYDDVTAELGTTQEDLGTTQKDLEATQKDLEATQNDLDAAQKQVKQAEQDAAAAEKQAAESGDATKKAQAQADQARAEADAANAKLAIARDCAKAYLSAFGGVLEADDPEKAAKALRGELEGITADCKSALAAA